MTREVDARNLPCPQPVIKTKKALEEIEEGMVKVLVNSAESLENVRRFAQSQGCRVDVTGEGADFQKSERFKVNKDVGPKIVEISLAAQSITLNNR